MKTLSKHPPIHLRQLDSHVVEVQDKRLCASFTNYCGMLRQRGRGLAQDYTEVTSGLEAAGMPLTQQKQLKVGLTQYVLYLISNFRRCVLAALKITTTRKSIFSGINLNSQSGGLLVSGGVSKLYNLICEGEDVEGNGTSWGFVYTKDKITLARGTVIHYSKKYC